MKSIDEHRIDELKRELEIAYRRYNGLRDRLEELAMKWEWLVENHTRCREAAEANNDSHSVMFEVGVCTAAGICAKEARELLKAKL